MKKLIATVGTSLFSNYQLDEVRDFYGRDYDTIDEQLKRIEKAKAVDVDNKINHPYTKYIREKIKEFWFDYKGEPNLIASAEIASILNIAKQKPEEFMVHLLATDTLSSVLAAELIQAWFEQNKAITPGIKEVLFQKPPNEFTTQQQSDHVIKNLQVNDQNLYEQGFMNLIELLDRICKPEHTILNITGGYKSIVPIMTLYGQLKKLPVKYLFNEQDLSSSGEVLTIDNLPINFDWPLGELYLDYLTREGLNKIVSDDELILTLESFSLISSTIAPNNKRVITLTFLGDLFKRYVEDLNNEKKGDFGFFVELRLLEHFTNKYPNQIIVRSKSYWWDNVEKSVFYRSKPSNGENAQEIEIDLYVVDEDKQEIWYEVKSCSSTGLNKAKKQIEKKIQFWQSTSVRRPDKFHLILYKIPKISVREYTRKINEISELFKDESCVFVLEWFDLPVKQKGHPDYKKFSSQEPSIHTITLEHYV